MSDPPNPLNPPKGIPPKALDELYHRPLEEFTAARNELAKELRSDGKAEPADWVKGLPKPSRAAWLVNQLSEQKDDEVAELLQPGGERLSPQREKHPGTTQLSAAPRGR